MDSYASRSPDGAAKMDSGFRRNDGAPTVRLHGDEGLRTQVSNLRY